MRKVYYITCKIEILIFYNGRLSRVPLIQKISKQKYISMLMRNMKKYISKITKWKKYEFQLILQKQFQVRTKLIIKHTLNIK